MIRGATLIEMLVVLAILGVIAALAVPNLVGMTTLARGQSEVEAVASLVDAARQLAVSEGRCVRVVQVGTSLRSEQRITGDCFNLAAQTGVAGWKTAVTIQAPIGITYSLAGQSLGTPGAPVNNDDHRIIFRPSGRLWGNGDLDVTDDGARIIVKPSTGTANQRGVVITGVGRICTRFYGSAVPAIGSAGAVSCP